MEVYIIIFIDHSLSEGVGFPNIKKHTFNCNCNTMVLFLTTNCNACIEIIRNIEFIKHKWIGIEIVLFIESDKRKFKEIENYNCKEVTYIRYNKKYQRIFRTGIFPFLYYLSKENIILSKGSIDHEKDIALIIDSVRTNK